MLGTGKERQLVIVTYHGKAFVEEEFFPRTVGDQVTKPAAVKGACHPGMAKAVKSESKCEEAAVIFLPVGYFMANYIS